MSDYERRGRRTAGGAGSDATVGRLDRRTLLKTTAGGAAGVTLAGCLGTYDAITRSSRDDDTVTIGFLAPQPQSDFIGRSMEQAAQVAVDELNDDGGLLGHDVELVVGDTNGSPTEARRVYQRLILEEGADVTMGMFDSASLMNIMNDIAEQETLHLTSGAATVEASRLVNRDYDRYKYHFRVGPTNDIDLGNAQVSFLEEFGPQMGWDSIAVLVEDYPWTDNPWEIFQDELDDVIDVTFMERYAPATNDFSELFGRVMGQGGEGRADAAFITTAHTGVDAVTQWNGGELPFAFGGIHVPMQFPTFFDDVFGLCEYGLGYSTATEHSEITDRTQHFVNLYNQEHDGHPQDMGYNSYDAVRVFAEAVESAGTLDTDELIPTLEEITVTGATGNLEFHGPEHEFTHDLIFNPDDPTAVYFQWQTTDEGEGVREVIWPEEHRTDIAEGEYVQPDWF